MNIRGIPAKMPAFAAIALILSRSDRQYSPASIHNYPPDIQEESSDTGEDAPGGRFYKLAMYVCLAVSGGAVHLPCGAFMWICKSVTGAAGQTVGYDIAFKYLLYFMLPVVAVFAVFCMLRHESASGR